MSLLKQTLLGNDIDTKTALLKLLDDDIQIININKNCKYPESLSKLKQTLKNMILNWSQKYATKTEIQNKMFMSLRQSHIAQIQALKNQHEENIIKIQNFVKEEESNKCNLQIIKLESDNDKFKNNIDD